jgi:uncharacterized iron-regulated membrane protein
MLTQSSIRTWAWIHKWTSLLSTVFILLLCLTGLPLIFHEEIGHLLGTEVEAPAMPADTPHASLDRVVAAAQARHPDRHVQFVVQDSEEPALLYVTLAEHLTDVENQKSVVVDARTAQVLAEPKFDEGFMYVMLTLHTDLFAGLPGKLFLGFMGLLLVVAVVSGVVLYAPFMRKLAFGTVRRDRARRTKWLDLHNMLGAVTLVWVTVVGFTGVLNTWADLMLKYWQFDSLTPLLAPYQGQPLPARLASLEDAVNAAQAREPRRSLSFVAYPGTAFSSPHHYAIFLRGDTPFTSRLVKPVLADAQTAQVTNVVDLPWYLTALLVSQPLHFGDYGGMPMQVLWALLDVLTIVVLGSGMYLWLQRRRAPADERVRILLEGTEPFPLTAARVREAQR